ncbi:MAG: hypothetical protein LRY63_10810 [Nitrincola sp.]|nr:hypothetical protein [Nitrincola sp.]
MPLHFTSSEKTLSQAQWKLRTTTQQWLIWLGWLAGVSLFLLCWKVISDNTMWVFVQDAPKQGADLISRMLPPDWTYSNRLWKAFGIRLISLP